MVTYPRLALAAWAAFSLRAQFSDPNRPEEHAGILDHFKYGSIGAEERAGIPYWIWRILPDLFPQHLPNRPGNGYERFGFVREKGKPRPIGVSYRERRVPFAGLNCAVCHTGTIRDTPASERRIVLGMPAHQFDPQSYQQFLFKCFADPGFTTDRVLEKIQYVNPDFGWFDRLTYRLFVVGRTRDEGTALAKQFAWMDSRPRQGPGRVDTFNPYKAMFGFDLMKDASIGTADLPTLFDQRSRDHLWLHWDGNNDLVTERNKSAAIGAGASETSLDLPAMKRIEDWIWDLKPPAFPADRIDQRKAAAGAAHYERYCADCHTRGRGRTGQVIPIEEAGTDPARLRSFTAELATKMNTLGTGQPWKFSRFRQTNGYAAMPLDGVWLRAPYLHNGSVPTLRDLLTKPEERPTVFWRGYDVYDYAAVGFVTTGTGAEREGFRYDTALPGNGRAGHAWGTALTAAQKAELIEYLKGL